MFLFFTTWNRKRSEMPDQKESCAYFSQNFGAGWSHLIRTNKTKQKMFGWTWKISVQFNTWEIRLWFPMDFELNAFQIFVFRQSVKYLSWDATRNLRHDNRKVCDLIWEFVFPNFKLKPKPVSPPTWTCCFRVDFSIAWSVCVGKKSFLL